MFNEGNPIKNLGKGSIAIGVVAMIILVLIAIMSQYAYTVRTPTTTSITALAVTEVGFNSPVGTSGQFPFLAGLTGCVNTTTSIPTTMYSVKEGNKNGGYFVLDTTGAQYVNRTWNCTTLSYRADSTSQGVADSFTIGLAVFATFAAVLVLAMMGKGVIGLFTKK